MGSFWVDNAPHNTGVTGGMMGGFQPAPVGAPSNPTVTTQPQPYQQGPGGTTPPNSGMTLHDVLQGRLSQIQQQHPAGSLGGNILQMFSNPQFQSFLQSRKQTPSAPGMQQAGQVAGQVGQWMQGGRFQPPQSPPQTDLYGTAAQAVSSPQFGPVAQQAMNWPQQQGQQIGSAIAQPANPSQQSGQVGMMSPTGQFQYVNAEHVPHYQNMGATIHNGSSYGSQSGGF